MEKLYYEIKASRKLGSRIRVADLKLVDSFTVGTREKVVVVDTSITTNDIPYGTVQRLKRSGIIYAYDL
jgi:hypothetical protein